MCCCAQPHLSLCVSGYALVVADDVGCLSVIILGCRKRGVPSSIYVLLQQHKQQQKV